MARFAAAGCLVWAVLLTSGVLADAGFSTFELLLIEKFFTKGSLPPPVRLYSKQNPYVNAAVSGDKLKVVLTKSDCHDPYQKWYVLPSPICYFYGNFNSFYSCIKSFSLMNAATGQVVVVPKDGSLPVQLSQPLDFYAATNERWTQGLRDGSDFCQILPVAVYPYGSKALNGLGGYVGEWTTVGIYSSSPATPNTLWKIDPFPLCFP